METSKKLRQRPTGRRFFIPEISRGSAVDPKFGSDFQTRSHDPIGALATRLVEFPIPPRHIRLGQEVTGMFAQPVAKAKTKRAASVDVYAALRNSSFIARPTGRRTVDHLQTPPSIVGGLGSSWDFGEIPVFAPDRSDRTRARDTARRSVNAKKPKLAIGRISDPLEREADRVADQVMGTVGPSFVAISAGPAQISRKCALCQATEEDEEKVYRKPAGSGVSVGEAPAIVHEVLRSPGQPIDSGTRAFFEPRFGRSLSHIRVHTDAAAAASAQAIGARAYTRGPHIVFAGGHYQTETPKGRHLLAHELAHTAQQEHGASSDVQRAICSEYNESTAAQCGQHKCITADGADGKCKKTGLHVCMCGPARMWRLIPDWILALLGAAALAALVVCFATGVCEFAAAVAGLGALAAAAVIGILKAAGIKDSGA